MAMKVESDGAARVGDRPRLQMSEELWRYLVSISSRRSEAVQSLHNLAAALEGFHKDRAAKGTTVSPISARILAFCQLTGIATDARSVWPREQADFYFLALHALVPAWATQTRDHVAVQVASEAFTLPTFHVIEALKYLIKEPVLLHRLTTRVKAAAKEDITVTNGPATCVDLDWVMTVLMQAWEDSQLAASKALQHVFLEADDNGDGILQLDEFYSMLKQRKPTITEGESFKLYDEAIALSEQILGYETDAILAEAFIRVAISHNMFPDLAQPLRTPDEAKTEPPPGWGGGEPQAPHGSHGASQAGLSIASRLGGAGNLMTASTSSPLLADRTKTAASRLSIATPSPASSRKGASRINLSAATPGARTPLPALTPGS